MIYLIELVKFAVKEQNGYVLEGEKCFEETLGIQI